MSNTLYIEPFSGIAGDMLLSALCSLADAHEAMLELPGKLHLPEAKVEVDSLNKNGIVCKHIKITDTGDHKHALHDHGHHHHHGEHRHLSDIIELIDAAHLPDRTKEIAKEIFQIIGESEARIHDIPIEKIHFHEVSGVDSILDIVGCAWLIDRLDISETYCDPICVGFGSVQTQHGLLPVPAPATADILRGMPTFKGDEQGERCTPTGAAVLKYLKPKFSPPPHPAKDIGYGPGQKNFKGANVVRVSILEQASDAESSVWIIETNIDDSSPELLGSDFQDGLLASGALDFQFLHSQMKKGRPGLMLSVLAAKDQLDPVCDYLLENSTAIGLRYYLAKRKVLKRRKVAIDTEFGTLLAKETELPSGEKSVKFEYESLREAAAQNGLSITTLKQRLTNH